MCMCGCAGCHAERPEELDLQWTGHATLTWY